MTVFSTNTLTRRMSLISSLALALLLIGCASAPLPPTESLNAAKTAIDSAEQADARQYAGAELEEARAQLVMAEKAVAAKTMTRADQLAQQSRVAAELAMARTQAAKAAEINREMGRGADALDVEMKRQGDQQ
jgi:PBP1b-binding outer membrane lipoprotein LpoB